jgi:hypothetical protein
MPLPDIQLANEALRKLGEMSITSLDEGTDLAETVNLLQVPLTTHLLTCHPWRFTMQKAQLARLSETPVNEWQYTHAKPAGCIMLRALYPSGAVGAQPLREFELFDDRILSNVETLWADFQTDKDPATWPAYFRALATNALAAEFAIPVGASASAADLYGRRAFGTPQEIGEGGLMRQAKRLDSQQQPPQQIRDFPLAAARSGRG